MERIAKYIFNLMQKWKLPILRSLNVEMDLRMLHPGEKLDGWKEDYYVKKIRSALMVLLIGLVVGAGARMSNRLEAAIVDGIVERQNLQEGGSRLQLKAITPEGAGSYSLHIEPRMLEAEEVQRWLDEFLAQIEHYILGRNTDLGHINQNLILEETYESFPFDVEWFSSNPEIISRSGRVSAVEAEIPVQLGFSIEYFGEKYNRDIQVVVVPPIMTEEERDSRELQDYLNRLEREHRTEEKLQLPDSWKGKEINWSHDVEDYSLAIWLAAPLLAGLIFYLSDKDLHGQVNKRKKGIERDYADIVHKIALYIGAGMTVRGAVQKLGLEYEAPKDEKERRYGYEEIKFTCRELQAGVSEGTAYERLGKRTGVKDYIKLSSILIQNLRWGNGNLQQRLAEEAERAIEGRLSMARKLGEESGTRLLLPMVMMLGIAMLMILIPAFGGI